MRDWRAFAVEMIAALAEILCRNCISGDVEPRFVWDLLEERRRRAAPCRTVGEEDSDLGEAPAADGQ
jgi:hypothetical protein